MADHFVYGPLCHAPLLALVLGRAPEAEPAVLPDRALCRAKEGPGALILKGGAGVEGWLLRGLGPEAAARLAFYETSIGHEPHLLAVHPAGGGTVRARVFCAAPGPAPADGPWSADGWRDRWAETVLATAGDLMAHFGQHEAGALRRRHGQMLVRGGARMRAGADRAGTASLRRRPDPADVAVEALHHPYNAYFAVEERDLRFRRFDGRMSGVLNRAVFISGDAAVLLPYDPVRDRVMLIEQFRAGPHARGDANPWLIEAIAGRIDGGETPEQAARREAVEEAGLSLGALLEGPRYYPSPAAKAEYIYSFVGIADLPDEAAGLGGLASEAEDIRSHVIPFDRLMALVASGEVDNAPLLILALWLQSERPRLRAAAGA